MKKITNKEHDYIDRNELNKRLEGFHLEKYNIYAVHAIAEIPSADVAEVKHEKWTYDEAHNCYCSGCQELALYDGEEIEVFSNYCPHCGAKMDAKD